MFSRLARVVRRADAFVLGFVKCNSPAQQQQLSRILLERLADKRGLEIVLDEPIISLLDKLEAVINVDNPPDFVNVYGLEKSIYGYVDYSPVLGRLNNDRDLIRRACPTVLLLWLPDYALDRVAISAPDFWAWRSGVYELPTMPHLWRNDSVNALESDVTGFESLSYNEKTAEVERVEELLRTAQSLNNQDHREQEIIARLLVKSAMLCNALGRPDLSRQRLHDALALANRLGDKYMTQLIERMLAEQYYQIGEIDQAEQLFLLSIEGRDGSSHQSSQTASYFRLGEIAKQRGEFDKAKLYYKQIAAFSQEPSSSMAGSALLAYLHQQQGELKEALALYQKMLEQLSHTNDKLRVAHILLQIGTLEIQRGNYTEAERNVIEALSIFKTLGDDQQSAITYGMLGQIKAEQGFAHDAYLYFLDAWRLSCKLQLPFARLAAQSIFSLGQSVGMEQLEQWINSNSFDKQQLIKELNQIYDGIILEGACSHVSVALKGNDNTSKEQLIQSLDELTASDVDSQVKIFYEALQGLLRGEQPLELSERLSPKYKDLFDEVWRPSVN